MKYPEEAKLCCPTCTGKGYIIISNKKKKGETKPYSNKTRDIRNAIRKLKKEGKLKGMTLRATGEALGIGNSPQKVVHHLSMIDKIGWENYEKKDYENHYYRKYLRDGCTCGENEACSECEEDK